MANIFSFTVLAKCKLPESPPIINFANLNKLKLSSKLLGTN